MEGIVDGDADDDGAYAHHDDGDARLEEGNHRQGEDPAEEDGYAEPQQVALAGHGEHKDAEDEDEGQGDGEIAVVLDLPRVGDGDGGSTYC